MHAHDLFGGDVTEHRDFLHCSSQQWFFTSTCDLGVSRNSKLCRGDETYQVGQETETSEIPYTSLGRFRLLLASNDWDE